MPASAWHSCRDAALFPNYFGQTCYNYNYYYSRNIQWWGLRQQRYCDVSGRTRVKSWALGRCLVSNWSICSTGSTKSTGSRRDSPANWLDICTERHVSHCSLQTSCQQHCLSVVGRPPAISYARLNHCLFLWSWPWLDDSDIRIWPRYSEDVYLHTKNEFSIGQKLEPEQDRQTRPNL